MRTSSLALMAALAMAPAAALATPAPAHSEVATTSAPATQTPAADDDAVYAQREQADKKTVEKFEGGSYVVIGLSGTAILVIILVLLLI